MISYIKDNKLNFVELNATPIGVTVGRGLDLADIFCKLYVNKQPFYCEKNANMLL